MYLERDSEKHSWTEPVSAFLNWLICTVIDERPVLNFSIGKHGVYGAEVKVVHKEFEGQCVPMAN